MARTSRPKSAAGKVFNTIRAYCGDVEELAALSKLSGRTAADVYRELCAPLVRKKLIDAASRRLEELRQGA